MHATMMSITERGRERSLVMFCLSKRGTCRGVIFVVHDSAQVSGGGVKLRTSSPLYSADTW